MFKKFLIIACVALAVSLVVVSVKYTMGEDNWTCKNGIWVKHGNPSTPKLGYFCDDIPDLIIVNKPAPGDEVVSSPFLVKGQARGYWFFEGVFPIKLLDENGRILSTDFATAQGEWMTDEFVPFTAEINYTAEKEMSAILVLERDNPSDLPENDASLSIPIRILGQ